MEWITTTTVLHDLKDFANQDAWGRFVGRFSRPIAAFGRSMGLGGTDAEELAQQTLAEFARAYGDGRYDRERGRLSSWLFAIAYRQGLKLLREAARRPATGEDTQIGRAPAEDEAAHAWEAEWEGEVLGQCIEQARREVEPVTFAAFELVVQRGLEPSQAATHLGVPVKSIYNAKHRVLRRIRELRAEFEAAEQERP